MWPGRMGHVYTDSKGPAITHVESLWAASELHQHKSESAENMCLSNLLKITQLFNFG